MSESKRVTRFWTLVNRQGPTDCWDWLGPLSRGYGHFGRTGAHRFAYELLVGPIPVGLVIDHLCRNRACVNPAHMEPVTDRVNVLRGVGPTARYARLTHCKRGHPLSGENLRVDKSFRRCRECGVIRTRAWRDRRRAA